MPLSLGTIAAFSKVVADLVVGSNIPGQGPDKVPPRSVRYHRPPEPEIVSYIAETGTLPAEDLVTGVLLRTGSPQAFLRKHAREGAHNAWLYGNYGGKPGIKRVKKRFLALAALQQFGSVAALRENLTRHEYRKVARSLTRWAPVRRATGLSKSALRRIFWGTPSGSTGASFRWGSPGPASPIPASVPAESLPPSGGSVMPFANTSPLLLGLGASQVSPGGSNFGLGDLVSLGVGIGQAFGLGPGGGRGTGVRAMLARQLASGQAVSYGPAAMPGGASTVPADWQLNLGGAEGVTLGGGACDTMFRAGSAGALTVRPMNTLHGTNPATGKQETWKRVIPTGWRIAGKRRPCRPRCATRRRRRRP